MALQPLNEATEYILRRHQYWYDHLSAWCRLNGIEPPPCPALQMQMRVTKFLGRYLIKQHTVVICVPFQMVLGDENDDTIAHEMCHAFQRAVFPQCKWHGETFLFLLRHVCQFREAGIRAGLSKEQVAQAKKLGRILDLQERIANASQVRSAAS